MLRINYVKTETEQRWTLCGQLMGPWIGELREFWEQTHHAGGPSRSVVDLSEVTFIDEIGERLLCDMRSSGVEFVAEGVDTRHMLENLTGGGERSLRRVIAPLRCDREKSRITK